MNRKILKLMANMLAIATFALISVSCGEDENTDSSGKAEISSISVEPRLLYLEVDSTGTLTATLSPDDALTDSLSWSTYNKDIATVSVTGPRTATVKGVSIGTTIINVVTSNSKRAICEVTVSKSVPVVEITVTPSDTLLQHLEPGNTVTLVATPGPANATNYHPVWTSNNTDVVTVENGVIKAVGIGTATVTVASGDVYKTVNVLVTNPLTSIVIEPGGPLHLTEIGNEQQLTATPTPEITKDYDPKWNSSDDNVVTVSQTGLVTAVGLGTARVTVASGTVSDTVEVKVTSAYLSDLIVNNEETTSISTGQTFQIDVDPVPETAENYQLTWASSNENVATVSETGLVTGVAAGKATIFVSSGNIKKDVTVFVDLVKSSPLSEGWTAESRGGNHVWHGDGGDVPYAGEPRCVIDGNPTTGFHSSLGTPLPQCLVVDMKVSKAISHIVIWHFPHALGYGWVYYRTIEVYLSDSPVTPDVRQDWWGAPVGTHNYTGGYNPVTIDFEPNSRGQYLVILFPDSGNNNYISFSELDVYEKR
jgi:uncharacterized protein YjdB